MSYTNPNNKIDIYVGSFLQYMVNATKERFWSYNVSGDPLVLLYNNEREIWEDFSVMRDRLLCDLVHLSSRSCLRMFYRLQVLISFLVSINLFSPAINQRAT